MTCMSSVTCDKAILDAAGDILALGETRTRDEDDGLPFDPNDSDSGMPSSGTLPGAGGIRVRPPVDRRLR